MAKKKDAEVDEPRKLAPPTPIPHVPEPVRPPERDNTPEPPEDQVPEVYIVNQRDAVMATEAEKAEGLLPKSTPDAFKAEDLPQTDIPAQ
jgi:alkanesulfonate monooxygenase SsuD/methylene tetrahydromethanopterin reductase-like flavin-dependent oxidoreductase (luciferase family)